MTTLQAQTAHTRQELLQALAQMQGEVVTYCRKLPAEEFSRGSAQDWSPAHHLHHLSLSNAPVAQALQIPRDRLGRRGVGRASRSYLDIRDQYRDALAGGAKASGRYVPDPQGDQATLVEEYAQATAAVRAALAGWTDADLDRFALTHPVLGELSVREMLLFTLYHNRHHLGGVKTRLEQA
ncbi:DinB family protein [Deinococcus aestuarii]|uniref:DinB family protein n=1 Tax=Deinococcus aestuarii TaxID=2774531 RepID=UPI001C0C97A7|nr:DinB family protein [Deinococcus aestuarii]